MVRPRRNSPIVGFIKPRKNPPWGDIVMPIVPSQFQSSVDLNNSFIVSLQGETDKEPERFFVDGGRVFSQSGFLNADYVKKEDSKTITSDLMGETGYLRVAVSPQNLYSTGISFVSNSEDLNSYLADHSEITFFTKSFVKSVSENIVDGDVFLFKNSGESPIFNGYLNKDLNGDFWLQIGPGKVNGEYVFHIDRTRMSSNKGMSVSLNELAGGDQNGGQKIVSLYSETTATSTETRFQQSLPESLSFQDLPQAHLNRQDDGQLEVAEEYTSIIPLFIVDLDRECVVVLSDRDIIAAASELAAGINENFSASVFY